MYSVVLHAQPPALALRGLGVVERTKHQLVFGVPAESFFRVAAPLLMGALSVAGLIYAAKGKQNIATTFALTGVLMSSLVAAGQAVASEEDRRR